MGGFKESVELLLEAGAERIVDTSNGRVLRLTPTEGQVLSHYDGQRTPAQLAELAQGAGVNEPEVAALLDRLGRNGLLAAPAPAPAAAAPDSELGPDDVVPQFREDLKVSLRPGTKAVLEVLDPARGRSFSLYDFEVSIARMLNGRRTVAEVVAAAGKIGIPVTPATLTRFIRQMRAYGFVSEAPAAERTLWRSRRAWSVEVRELYQSGLRLFRAQRYDASLEYLDALMQIDPENTEGAELKQRVIDARDGAVDVEVSFDDLHGEAVAQEPAPAAPEALEPAPPPAVEPAPPEPHAWEHEDDEEPLVAPRRSRTPLVVLAGLVVGALATAFFPVARTVTVAARVAPVSLGDAVMPRDGELAELKAKDGDAVQRGQVLATLSTSALEARHQALLAQAARDRREAAVPAKVNPRLKRRAEAQVARAKKDLARAHRAARGKKGGRLKAAEKAVAARQAALDRAEAALSKLLEPKQKAALEEKAKAAEDEAAELKPLLELSSVTAPADGRYKASGVAVGAPLKQGQSLGTVLDPARRQLSGPATGPWREADASQARVNGKAVALHDARWEDGTLSAWVDADAGLAEGPVTLELPAGQRPLVFALLGK